MLARSPIPVRVLHRDPLARHGVRSMLGSCPDFVVLDDDDAGPPLDDHVVCVADPDTAMSLSASIRESSPAAIVLVDGADRERELRRALQCRIRGYLVHGYAMDDLAQGVRTVHGGLRYLCWRAAGRLAESIASEALTDREEAVLDLIVDGLCNKAVARRLDIALGTVKSHLKSAYAKLQVQSRTQAIAVLNRRGLLDQRQSRALAAPDTGHQDVVLTLQMPHWSRNASRRPSSNLASY